MEHISFSADLIVGVELIDSQHRRFFQEANRLAEAMWEGKGRDMVGGSLNFLTDYAGTHFRDEENLMLQHSYAEYPAQKAAHEAFVKQMKALQERLASGENPSNVAADLLGGACEWFRNHIRVMDKPMGAYVSSRG
jgi:hemerythrin-like metal-binding protein